MTGAEPLSFGDALAWLDRHINLEAIERGAAGRAAEPTLVRIAALLEAMDNPQANYPVIHVTGTNGKGSTTRIATALLLAQGLSTGTIMSPHLERLNERICRDLHPITDDELLDLLIALETLEDFVLADGRLGVAPTWFELVTAAGFRYLADVAVDAAVIEVGLGGRYDATNVANGIVAVITNVDLDHVEILGPTRSHIAAEKSGIIKPDATVVVGDEDDDVVEIVNAEAELQGAGPVWRRGRDFACVLNEVAHGGRLLSVRTPYAVYEGHFLGLHGAHQGANASAALVAVEAFFGASLSDDVVAEAFAAATVPGRLEVVGRRPLVILDGAHNAAGARTLGASLAEDFAGVERFVVVMGCLRGRDPAELFEGIGPERVQEVVTCRPQSPRAQSAEDVADALRGAGSKVRVVDDVAEAVDAACELATEEGAVVVTGSLYVVGSARTSRRRLGSLHRE